MEDLIKEVQKQVMAKAKKENRKDFENLFHEVMKNRLAFYNKFDENFDLNVTNIQHHLENN
jgi:predicted amidophosphoribosyltransferase